MILRRACRAIDASIRGQLREACERCWASHRGHFTAEVPKGSPTSYPSLQFHCLETGEALELLGAAIAFVKQMLVACPGLSLGRFRWAVSGINELSKTRAGFDDDNCRPDMGKLGACGGLDGEGPSVLGSVDDLHLFSRLLGNGTIIIPSPGFSVPLERLLNSET